MIVTNIHKIAPIGLLAACVLLSSCDRKIQDDAIPGVAPEVADLVLVNGGVYTGDARHSWAQAIAVRAGVIIAVGGNDEIKALTGPQTRSIDLSGKMALPGFHDAHVHPTMGGYALLGCSLESESSVDALIAKVATCVAQPGEGWLVGHAFDLSLFGQHGPDKSLLDAIDTERPIFLQASDGHNAWANSEALKLAGITAATPAPPLGVIEREADGSPNGTLRETAADMVTALLPKPTLESNVTALRAGIRHLNSFGITSFIDAMVGLEDYQAYQAIDQAGELSARVVTCLTYKSGFAKHRGADFESVLASRHQYESERINNDCIKLFLDGVLEGETAVLLAPYLDKAGWQGKLIIPADELDAAVTRFDAMGLQVHMHAIGDGAVRAGLDAIEAARKTNGSTDNRHHIAHLQLINVDDIERFSSLNVAANFQALWAEPDDWILQLNLPVLGQERVQGMYPIASVERAGGRIVGGSDWNVSSANPLDAIEVAMTRQDPLTNDGPILNANEAVSLASMLDAYTINAAWLMHHEDQTGSIETGKRADLVVLDHNLFEIPVTAISETRALMTLLDGQIIYTAKPGHFTRDPGIAR